MFPHHLGYEFAILAVVCTLAMFLFPTARGPYSVVHGLVTALLSLHVRANLWLDMALAAPRLLRHVLDNALNWAPSGIGSCYERQFPPRRSLSNKLSEGHGSSRSLNEVHARVARGAGQMKKALVMVAVFALWPMFAPGRDKAKDGLESPGKTMANPINAQVAVCTFADGKQLSVRYNPLPVDRSENLSEGKLWPSGNSMFLFSPMALTVGNSTIPVGAFSMYVIPGHNDWTLIINKNVTENVSYDEAQDLLRIPMNTGQVEQPAKDFVVYFAHLAPKQCNMRLYYGTTGAWAEFREP